MFDNFSAYLEKTRSKNQLPSFVLAYFVYMRADTVCLPKTTTIDHHIMLVMMAGFLSLPGATRRNTPSLMFNTARAAAEN
jgi:hypothetical protein